MRRYVYTHFSCADDLKKRCNYYGITITEMYVFGKKDSFTCFKLETNKCYDEYLNVLEKEYERLCMFKSKKSLFSFDNANYLMNYLNYITQRKILYVFLANFVID